MNKDLLLKGQVFSIVFIISWLIIAFLQAIAPYIWPDIDYSNIYLIKGIVNFIAHIGFAIWIFIEAKKLNFYPILWAALAIFSGLISIVLFYWILIHKELKRSRD